MTLHEFIDVDCQVCGSQHAEEVYVREFETLSFGRLTRRLWLCSGCGFLYASPRPGPEALDYHYRRSDHGSGAIWHARGEGSRHHRLTTYRRGFIERHVRDSAPGRVLDVGCSQGDLLAALKLPGWDRLGLEPSGSAAAKARKRGLSVVEATLEQNPLASESFDLITCISVLEHVSDVAASMHALERLLAPGGHLALYVPDSTRAVAHVAEFFSFEHISHFSAGSASRLLTRFGLRPLEIEQAEGPGLMLISRKEGRAASGDVDSSDDRELMRAAVERYREDRRRFDGELRERFAALQEQWKSAGARVAIYGAGEHTQFLLELSDFSDQVVAIFDSDPAKHGRRFLRWRVSAPERASEIGIDAIVLSSRPYQDEMHSAVAHTAAEHGIEVVRCYPRTPAAA
jgi:SAM-dependent methyltransferase